MASSKRLNGDGGRALLLYEHSYGGEIDEAIDSGLRGNGYEVTSLRKGQPWEPNYDIVIGYGPFSFEDGHLLTVARQVQALPTKYRPLFVWWLTENPPPAWIPRPVAESLAALRVRADNRLAGLPAAGWRKNLTKGHRLRVLGQLRTAAGQGLPDILVVTNRARGRYYEAYEIESLVAPLGYHRSYGYNMGLERDIDVAFIGQLTSRRRRKILRRIVRDLHSRGISTEIVSDLYENERTLFLNRTRILVNILRSPQDFVGQRLTLAAANGVLTVSEPMLDPYPFTPGEHFLEAPWTELAETIQLALGDNEMRGRIVEQACRLVTQELTCEKMVGRILEHDRNLER